MSAARFTHDPDVDAAYFSIAPTIGAGESAENVIIDRPGGDIVLDFDADGRLLGVEILGAEALLTPATIESADVLSAQASARTAPTPRPDRTVPNLPSRSFDATEAFYSSFGFERRFRDDGWLILARGPLELEFFPAPDVDPFSSGFMCCVRVADLDELYDTISASGVPEKKTGMPRLHPIRREPWGLRAGYLVDLDGTQLTLIEDRL